jgi:hypothetical protein
MAKDCRSINLAAHEHARIEAVGQDDEPVGVDSEQPLGARELQG